VSGPRRPCGRPACLDGAAERPSGRAAGRSGGLRRLWTRAGATWYAGGVRADARTGASRGRPCPLPDVVTVIALFPCAAGAPVWRGLDGTAGRRGTIPTDRDGVAQGDTDSPHPSIVATDDSTMGQEQPHAALSDVMPAPRGWVNETLDVRCLRVHGTLHGAREAGEPAYRGEVSPIQTQKCAAAHQALGAFRSISAWGAAGPRTAPPRCPVPR